MASQHDIELLREYATKGSEEAFGELVRRHLPLVYSTALRSTGNAHAAEEIAQGVFLNLARKASVVPDRVVLSGWLYHTARLMTRNYLRGEMRRQLREQEAYMDAQTTDTASAVEAWLQIAPVLEEAMGTLGEADRNAIVLRFFENKPLEEVGSALGATADAARMRVNRALEKLRRVFARRGVTLGASVIAGALSAHSVQAAPAGLAAAILKPGTFAAVSVGTAGIGSKIGSAITQSSLFSWTATLFGALAVLPGMLLATVLSRLDRDNFRDPTGFRPRLQQLGLRSFLWGYPLLFFLLLAFLHFGRVRVTDNLALWFVTALTLIAARSLVVCRNLFHVGMFAYCVILDAGLLLRAFGALPAEAEFMPFILANFLFLVLLGKRPTRMDYNLLLRTAQGMIKDIPAPPRASGQLHLRRAALLAFGRFLGTRFLVTNYEWRSTGLALRLPPVRGHFLRDILAVFLPLVPGRCSHLVLQRDGVVIAHCSTSDRTDLQAMPVAVTATIEACEEVVARAVAQAWAEFRAGSLGDAERCVGESPVSEVFVVPPSRARATFWWRIAMGAALVLILLSMAMQFWGPPALLSGLRKVAVNEAQVRAFMNRPMTESDQRQWNAAHTSMALFDCLVLPSTNLFDAQALERMRDEVSGLEGFAAVPRGPDAMRWVFANPMARHALAGGWLDWPDLGLGSTHPKPTALFTPSHLDFSEHWDRLLTRRRAWSWVMNQADEVMVLGADGLAHVRLLQRLGCLDLVNRQKLAAKIASAQVRPGHPDTHPMIHSPRAVRGLFFTPCFPALVDTYHALAALEILGALNRIDRDLCVDGILRLHRGKGFFVSPASGGYNEYHIRGDARDTLAAYESLRILGALDRVKDLEHWQFRPERRGIAAGDLTWRDVEAWVCQMRFERILSSRNRTAMQPYGSLLMEGTAEERQGK